MPNAAGLIKAIKQATVEAVDASKPVQICFGKVTSASPLKILVEQKMTLGEAQLILTRNVTTYQTSISGGNIQDFYYMETPSSSSTLPVEPPHLHAVGRIQVTVDNGLAVGDEVILLRQQGGQKYIVADKVG